MQINEYASKNQIYLELAKKIGELNSIDNKEAQKSFHREDFFELSGENKYDEYDYKRVLEKFKNTDSNIRAHEQSHAASGNTTSPISYRYQTGPDGKLYAVGGEVRLDTSLPRDPEAARFKLSQIQNAASSPSHMSGADAQISIQANLNKMLLQLQGDENAS